MQNKEDLAMSVVKLPGTKFVSIYKKEKKEIKYLVEAILALPPSKSCSSSSSS